MSESKKPTWLTYDQVIAVHSLQLRRFGGAPGAVCVGFSTQAIAALQWLQFTL